MAPWWLSITTGFIGDGFARIVIESQFGRVVKASDSKSDGVTRVGSNPAADVSFSFYKLILI